MNDFANILRREMDATPVIDPHSHMRAGKPEARDLADIVLYHHVWIELVSSGMPQGAASRAGLPHEVADPGMPALDRVRAALPYLLHIRSTTCGTLLRWILAELYGVPGGVLTADNLEQVGAQVEARSSDPAWRAELFDTHCRIAKTITVERSAEPHCPKWIGKGTEGVPLQLATGKRGPRETLAAIEKQLKRELRQAGDYAEGMRALGKEYSNRGLHFVGVWLPPSLSLAEPSDAEMGRLLAAANADDALGPGQLGAFAAYGLRRFLEGMREGPVRTIQVIAGADVLPPHRSLTQWSPEFPGALGRLAAQFEDFEFSCSSASDLFTQDLAILAKHLPNVSVAGYWWHVLYPHYIRKSIETRLDIVPASKIVAFFSDAYHAEWCYPKLKLVKQIFAEVLMDRVSRGLATPEIALSLIRQVFYENPKRIYRVGD